MTPPRLTAIIESAITALGADLKPCGGLSLEAVTSEAIEAALAMPGAKFERYAGRLARDRGGYVRVTIAGVVVAIHGVPLHMAAAAGFKSAHDGARYRK